MTRMLRLFGLIVALAATLALVSCGGDDDGGNNDQFLSSFTGDCPRGPLGYWECNMVWDQECWQ